jgi:hypothetical protein
LSFSETLRFYGAYLPEQLARMGSELRWIRIHRRRGEPRPPRRFASDPITGDVDGA